MLGEGAPAHHARMLDALIPDLVRAGANRNANIYLLSSPQDEHYSLQVEPFLGLFQGYENFNYLHSESPTITGHATVTRRNVPALVGLLNLLADGYAPRLGFVRHAPEDFDADRSAVDAYLAATSKVQSPDHFPPPVVGTPRPGTEVAATDLRFTGTAPGAVRVSMWKNGKFVASPQVAPDGTWHWEPPKPWARGKHSVKIFAVDPAGFHSGRVEVAFTVRAGGTAARAPEHPGHQAHRIPEQPGHPAHQVPGQPLQAPEVHTPEPYAQVAGSVVRFTGLAAGRPRSASVRAVSCWAPARSRRTGSGPGTRAGRGRRACTRWK